MQEGLCLTYPGPENPASWGPNLAAQPCNPASVEQHWALNNSVLEYTGQPGAVPVCIAPRGTYIDEGYIYAVALQSALVHSRLLSFIVLYVVSQ